MPAEEDDARATVVPDDDEALTVAAEDDDDEGRAAAALDEGTTLRGHEERPTPAEGMAPLQMGASTSGSCREKVERQTSL